MTKNEEIQELSKMLFATKSNDTKRIDSICERLQELKDVTERSKKKRLWQVLREVAIKNKWEARTYPDEHFKAYARAVKQYFE